MKWLQCEVVLSSRAEVTNVYNFISILLYVSVTWCLGVETYFHCLGFVVKAFKNFEGADESALVFR
jgi:hypothetical protein